MALLGYARVSTDLQDPRLQIDALTAARCDKVYVEHASGTKADRPQLAALLGYARSGDVIVVWRLDRLGRSVGHLVGLMEDLRRDGVGLHSLTEGLDTGTPGGMLIFHVFAALAQFESDLGKTRTKAGLDAARARGRRGGRPTVVNDDRRRAIEGMLADGRPVAAAARAVGVSRATVYRHLARERGRA